MQQELRSSYPALRIQLMGVNEKGQEPGNVSATAGRTIPWLQDVDANVDGKSDVFTSWAVALRDVVILDGTNAKVGVYNLNSHDLANSTNFATLREMLVDAAMASQRPWQNAADRLDVDASDTVTPLDALIVINRLNASGAGELPPPVTAQLVPPFYDVSGENEVTALDALQVINYLNARSVTAGGEGESISPAMELAADPMAEREIIPALLLVSDALRSGLDPARPATPAEDGVQQAAQTDYAWCGDVERAFGTEPFSMPPGTSSGSGLPSDSEEVDDWWLPIATACRAEDAHLNWPFAAA